VWPPSRSFSIFHPPPHPRSAPFVCFVLCVQALLTEDEFLATTARFGLPYGSTQHLPPLPPPLTSPPPPPPRSPQSSVRTQSSSSLSSRAAGVDTCADTWPLDHLPPLPKRWPTQQSDPLPLPNFRNFNAGIRSYKEVRERFHARLEPT
jgi:hypothetical protein